jgi:hypothetical protein
MEHCIAKWVIFIKIEIMELTGANNQSLLLSQTCLSKTKHLGLIFYNAIDLSPLTLMSKTDS